MKNLPIQELSIEESPTITIMVVDHLESSRSTLGREIKRLVPSATILDATHGKEALLFISSMDGNVDVVISDVVMSNKMGGVRLAKAIRKNHPNILVILMGNGREPKNHKAHHFLAKPLTRTDLAVVIGKKFSGSIVIK